jgi:hypothetical protein
MGAKEMGRFVVRLTILLVMICCTRICADLTAITIPVTIKTAPHDAINVKEQVSKTSNGQSQANSGESFSQRTETFLPRCGRAVIASSPNPPRGWSIRVCAHRLEAYNDHYYLVIRCLNFRVWFSCRPIWILREEFRKKFTAPETATSNNKGNPNEI